MPTASDLTRHRCSLKEQLRLEAKTVDGKKEITGEEGKEKRKRNKNRSGTWGSRMTDLRDQQSGPRRRPSH